MSKKLFLLAVCCIPAGEARSDWAAPEPAPVERLVRNMEQYVRENADDPQGYYLLGRIHGLAFALKTRTLATWPNATIQEFIADDIVQKASSRLEVDPAAGEKEKAPDDAELLGHVAPALKNFAAAIRRKPGAAIYYLGHASFLEAAAPAAHRVDVLPGAAGARKAPDAKDDEIQALFRKAADAAEEERRAAREELRKRVEDAARAAHERRADPDPQTREAAQEILRLYWMETALSNYREACKRAMARDLKIKEQPMRGLRELIGYEAGKACLRILKERGIRESEREEAERLEKDLKALEAKPESRAITPIIFSLEEDAGLDALLLPGSSVIFDLDGDDLAERWPWVGPSTGILAWDPERTGCIVSGRQMFGSATWWMFFEDGYRALDALDDDRDRFLSGAELGGLAVWFDRNGDAVPDAGEVAPIEDLPIAALSTEAAGRTGESPFNLRGLVLRNGRVLPTYDWVAHSMVEKGPAMVEKGLAIVEKGLAAP